MPPALQILFWRARRVARAVRFNLGRFLPVTPEERFRAIAAKYAEMITLWDLAPSSEKDAIAKLARRCGKTNCNWYEYGAAQEVLRKNEPFEPRGK